MAPRPEAGLGGDGGGQRGLLRFLTCGSVDDGKSTLIGRMLFDTELILEDQLAALEKDSRRHGTTGDDIDLALLVDGLEAEREQGITIDVAYRYFMTPGRSFIVADAPGHEQYTRNMATGASNSDLAVILVDARKGVLPQTRRHSFICSLLGIRHVALAVNKIDLVDYSQEVFEGIVEAYTAFATELGFVSIVPVPLSARHGDNVATRSVNMPWYEGPTLLEHLERVDVEADRTRQPLRFPVQRVNRPNLDFRGVSGTVTAGTIAVGDPVLAVPSGRSSRVARLVTADGDLASAAAGDAITITLEDDIDVGRGEVLARPEQQPEVADQLAAHLIWMGDEPLLPGRAYHMRIGMTWTQATVTSLKHKVDPNTLSRVPARTLDLNDIGLCNISTTRPVPFDRYDDNRDTGSFIFVDRITNQTVAAGMIEFGLRRAHNIPTEALSLDKHTRAGQKHQRPAILWFTGLSGSGKSTLAKLVEQQLYARGHHTYMLDGDNLRHGLNRDLGFTDADRVENIRRVGEVAKLFVDAGLVVLCSFISPFAAERRMVRDLVQRGEFIEIFVDTPLEECRRRDPKGLYAKAQAGLIKNFTGIDSPYERPENPEITLETLGKTPAELADVVLDYIDGAIRH